MPFGLANGPATYQRLFGNFNIFFFIYLENPIVFSNSYEENFERLDLVLNCLIEHGSKLSPKKCSEDVHCFLVFAGNYRKFIRDIAKIARSLTVLTPFLPKSSRKMSEIVKL